ncbi:hypothetical protein GT037_005646 [Alternaria burnsii]|uniref:Uncharacterized protein n=1 Tax=Alternaria burnsii TaxID=1187904 RepID=A0A8H7B6P0_9PLEO|nr:uncharacterized protein GT037_005646 [Alternaria burnsii]KAF7676141.1 hypothetical protein GT037_005646 [Alternaria burnsii]
MNINRKPGFRRIEYPIPPSSDEEEQEATSTELKEGTDAYADTLVLLQRLQHSEHRMAELMASMTQFINGQRDFYILTLGVIENNVKDIEGKTGKDQTIKADLSRYIGRLMRRTEGYSREMAIKVLQLSDALGPSACDVDATLERNSRESYDWCKTKTLGEDFPKDSPVIPQAIVIPNAKGASYGVSDVFKKTQGYRDLVNQEDSDGGSDSVSDKLSSNMGSSPTSSDDEASSTKSTSVSMKLRKRKPYRISGLSSTMQPPARPGKRQKRSANHKINEEGTNSDSTQSDDQRVVPPKRARKPYAR